MSSRGGPTHLQTLPACILAFLPICLVSCASTETTNTAPESAEPVSMFATYEGKQVHYLDTGMPGTKESAPTLVLVHGWACDSRVWDRQLQSLAPQARVIAVDLPAHGQSEIPDTQISMDLFARATAAVMDQAGVGQAVLVGHSNGTPVIRQFYRLFPARTQALVVVDGALRQMLTGEIIDQMKPRLSEENYRETVAAFIDEMPGQELSEAARDEIKAMALDQPRAAVYGGLVAAGDSTVWEPDPIEVPTLLILAEQPSWDEEYLAFVRKLAPQSEIDILPGVSHFIMTERPGKFDSLLTSFLEKNNLLESPASQPN